MRSNERLLASDCQHKFHPCGPNLMPLNKSSGAIQLEICGRVNPVIVAMRTTSRRNASGYLFAILYLFHNKHCSKEPGTHPPQIRPALILVYSDNLYVPILGVSNSPNCVRRLFASNDPRTPTIPGPTEWGAAPFVCQMRPQKLAVSQLFWPSFLAWAWIIENLSYAQQHPDFARFAE